MVNPDVDVYTKNLNHRKIFRKTQKGATFWKPKEY